MTVAATVAIAVGIGKAIKDAMEDDDWSRDSASAV